MSSPSYSLYQAHGLTFASAMPCPELAPSQETPDVFVNYGSVPPELTESQQQGVLYQLNARQCLFDLSRFAGVRYLVQNGNEIVIDRAVDAQETTVRLYLLGSCMAALLMQRGLLPLHSSTVLTPQGAVLFSGPSTSGKSTLAAAFLRRGYFVLADDISTIHFPEGGRPHVTPELKRLKLWTHTLDHFKWESEGLHRIRPDLEKFSYPLDEEFATREAPLHTLYLLHHHNKPEIEIAPVKGTKKFAQLEHAIYRKRFLYGSPIRGHWFQRLSRLAQSIQMKMLRYPHDLARLDELADLIERDFSESSER